MSDEIEIEEHDLLDDPTVRNIFPDISRLKQEILDYDYCEDPDFENAAATRAQHEDLNCVKSSADGEETENLPGDFEHNLQNSGPLNGFIRGDKGIEIKICNNKIILGSKPGQTDSNEDHFEKNVKPYCAVVRLENFGIFLKTCPRYCQHCHILFPTNEDSNIHDKNVHKEINETVDDKILARTDSSNVKHMLQEQKISKKKQSETRPNDDSSGSKRNKCFHCEKIFPTQNILIEHIYSIIQNPKSNSDSFSSKIIIGNKPVLENRNPNLTAVPKIKPNTNVEDYSKAVSTNHEKIFFKCHFCFLYFSTTKIYIRHMKLKHKIVKGFEISKVVFNPKCIYCPKVNDTLHTYNAHLRKSHSRKIQEAIEKSRRLLEIKSKDNLPQEISAQIKYYRCEFCCLYLSSLPLLIRHVTTRHRVMKISKPKKTVFDPKCIYCHRTYPEIARFNSHIYKVHTAIYKQIVQNSESTKSDTKSSMVSISNLSQNYKDTEVYTCNFCPVYFVTLKWLKRHLKFKHKRPNVTDVQTVKFDPKCKYCTKKMLTVAFYNEHLYKSHTTLLKNLQAMNSERAKHDSVKIKVDPKEEISKVKYNDTEQNNAGPINQSQQCDEVYICQFCPALLQSTKAYKRHMRIRHKNATISQPKKVKFDHRCKYCPSITNSVQAHNQHLYKYHQKQIKNYTKEAVDKNRKLFYRCCYCSHYFNSINIHNYHVLRKHKVKNLNDVKKIEFDPKCKYCPVAKANVLAYNKHLYSSHKHRVNEVFTGSIRPKSNEINGDISKQSLSIANKSHQPRNDTKHNVSSNIIPILKSALFKCHKCDIHFLAIKTALDHSNHMELLVNWKCSLCNRIFKDNDRWLHEKQHLISNVFTVYDLDTSITSQILYQCNKCALHYDESVDDHHRKCALEIPHSYLCEICKILVDSNARICHEYNHKHRNLTSNDFIVIETDVICGDGNKQNNLKRKNTDTDNADYNILKKKIKKDVVENCSNSSKKQQKFDALSLNLSHCSYCKSFVSPIGQKRKEHGLGLCTSKKKRTCYQCGLNFSGSTFRTHRRLHQRKKQLQLQNFKFYDFKSGKRTLPSMPEYKKCKKCDVNFISQITLFRHVCGDRKYKTCEICNIKLFTPVFNLHMPFHKYTIDEPSCASNNTTVIKKKEKINKLNEKISLILYCCKVCNLYVDTYDRLIEHCRKHCLDTLSTCKEQCKICKLNFEESSLKTHRKLHESLGEVSFDKLFIDPFYFEFESRVWLNHVFRSYSKIGVKDVIESSLYGSEHRFVLHIVQEGRADLTIYKCDNCRLCVEPDIIYQHIENSCSNFRKYPCSICHLDFVSSFSLTRHKNTHNDPEVTLKSYRIVHFNKQEDAVLNAFIFSPPKKYVLYQCRRCNGIVESTDRTFHVCHKNALKSCLDCGLLITDDLFEYHVSKHKTLDSYISENIKVILFGKDELDDRKVNTVSTFNGKVHDYSFYKCRNCQVCLKHKKSTLTHTCCIKNLRVACSKCGLYFMADKLVTHTKDHQTDPDFTIENMFIIDFNPTVQKPEIHEVKLINNTSDNDSAAEIHSVDVNKNVNESTQDDRSQENGLPSKTSGEITKTEILKVTDIYKCNCGLHFIDEDTVTEHIAQCGSKAKQAKQNCSKCGLLFTPNVLFKHLLSHHGDKLINYKFNIIEKAKV